MDSHGKRRIVIVVEGHGPCAWYRGLVPGVELMKLGHEVVMLDSLGPKDVEGCDILVAERIAQPRLAEAFKFVKEHGGLTVFDLDDDVWNVSPNSPAFRYWGLPEVQGAVANLIRAADLATTTTPALADRIRTFNRNVKVLPNFLPQERWPAEAKPIERKDPLVIGWAGSATHGDDFKVLGDTLSAVLEKYPHVEVHLAGAMGHWVEPHERIRHLEPVPIENYSEILYGFDIAVAPLADGRFNRCKSDLKVLEYAMIGLPVVASRVGPYAEFIKHGENGLLASNPKDWLRCLSRLVDEIDMRRSLGAAARASAERRTIERNIRVYERAYGLPEE
jgi:glycosyltransferase involved in cell wall biosynthesis